MEAKLEARDIGDLVYGVIVGLGGNAINLEIAEKALLQLPGFRGSDAARLLEVAKQSIRHAIAEIEGARKVLGGHR